MKKKTLQAAVIALGILSASFTVSAMGKVNTENSVVPETAEEVVGSVDSEKTQNISVDEMIKPEKLETDGEGEDKPKTGWVRDGENWKYRDENGDFVKNSWQEVGEFKYYFGEDGVMQTGWIAPGDGNWYYAYADGAAQTDWFQAKDGRWYYANKDGVMQTGWIAPGDGNWYYAYADGAMQTGWFQAENGRWYYANKDGVMQTGWIAPGDGNWYYAYADGAMQTGWFQAENGRWYYANKDGVMQTGWIAPGDGNWYYAYADGAIQTGWILTGTDDWYYAYGNGAIAINTWEKMNGQWYWFDESGLMAQGWKYIGRYKYYFDKSGYMLQDLDGVLGRQSSYEITVNRKRCQVMVYAKDGSNGYIIPVKTFTCSVGLPSTPTPTGTFYTPNKYRWHTLMGPSYGQYCTRINGGILFHSVAGYNMTSYNIHARDYNKLGSPASHGCVRLNVRDAKWIYDNCSLGTKVTISDSVATPFDKPATIKIPANQNWDPTDPNI